MTVRPLGTCDQIHTHRGFYRDDDDDRSILPHSRPVNARVAIIEHASSVLVRGVMGIIIPGIGCAEPFGKLCEYVNAWVVHKIVEW